MNCWSTTHPPLLVKLSVSSQRLAAEREPDIRRRRRKTSLFMQLFSF
jgi:hypothetical protein